jgi:hypothetical protein
MTIEDFGKHRDRRDGHRYRVSQAAYLLQRFEQAHGRQATTNDELAEWLAANPTIKAEGAAFDAWREMHAVHDADVLSRTVRRADRTALDSLLAELPAPLGDQARTALDEHERFSGLSHDEVTKTAVYIVANAERVKVWIFHPVSEAEATLIEDQIAAEPLDQ